MTTGRPDGEAVGPGDEERPRRTGTRRRPRFSRRRPSIAAVVSWTALVLFTVLSVGRPLVGDGVFIGTDVMAGNAPWRSETQSIEVRENLWIGDTIDSGMPQSQLLVSEALDGTFAQWNPYQAGGVEIGGIPNSGMFNPLSLPRWVLPLSYANGVVKVLEILAITVGMSLLLRRHRLPSASWAMASMLYASSGFLVSWTNWQHTRVAALIPLLFWAVDRAVVRRRPWDALPVGLVVGAMLLGGFPAVTGYALYGAGFYTLVRAVLCHDSWRRRLLSLAVPLAGVVSGFLLAAWQMIPFVYNAMTVVNFDSRAQKPTDHLGIADLATALVPGILGGPGDPAHWSPAHNPIENFSFLGIGALVLVALAVLAAPRNRDERVLFWFFGVSASFCLLLVYVGGPVLGLVQNLPIFSNNIVTRLRVMVGFFVAVFAAYGYARLITGSVSLPSFWSGPARRRLTALGRWLVVAALAVVAAFVVRSTLYLVPAEHIEDVRRETIVMLGIGIVLAAAGFLAMLTRRRAMVAIAAALIPVGVLVPAVSVTTTWWSRSESDTFYPMTETHAFLGENLDGARFTPVGQVALPGTNTFYRLRSLGGHAFHSPVWKDLIRAADPEAFLTQTYSSISAANLSDTVESPILDRLAVKYVVADPGSEILGSVEAGPDVESQSVLDESVPVSSPIQTGPTRGVLLKGITQNEIDHDGSSLEVRMVSDADGEVIDTSTTWAVNLTPDRWVALAGEDIADDEPWHLEATVLGLDATGTVGATADGELAIDVVRPEDDGLEVVHTGDATVYERSTALDRVRWASEAVVIADPDLRVEEMADGTVPAEVVVLDSADGLVEGGGDAVVTEEETDTNHVVAHVDADGPGWVVVADSLQRGGWSATVDGQPAELLSADHAAVAVLVSAGEHTVVLSYETPGLRTGLWVTGSTLVLILAAAGVTLVVRRRRGPDGSATP